MRAASPPRQIERENEMIVISHRLFVFVIPFKAFIVSARVAPPAEGVAILTRGMPLAVSSTKGSRSDGAFVSGKMGEAARRMVSV